MGCAIPYKRAGPGWTVEPDGLRPEPYTNRVKSQGFMGWRYEKSGFILSLWRAGCAHAHPHTPALHTKRHTKEKFSEKSDGFLHPHIAHRQPPMTPWRDGWTMGWVNAWTVGTVTGWGSGRITKTTYLTTYTKKGTIHHRNEERGRKRRLWRGGRTSDKHNLFI